MDNQPSPANNTPGQPVSQSPTPPPGVQSATPASAAPNGPVPPVSSVPPVAPTVPVQPAAPVAPPPQPATPKKKSKGLLISIICAVLLLIGGAAAAFIIIKTQPSSIIASSINNLLNAKHISVEGNFEMAASGASDDNYLKINFTTQSSESNSSTTAHAEVSLPVFGLYSPITLDFNEVLISDGKLYAKVTGTNEALSRENITAIGGSYVREDIINLIQGIGGILEDRWVMISLEEMLNNNLYSINEQTKQQILSTYNCSKDVMDNISRYSDETAGLYQNHPFITMEQQPDSFYAISFDPEQLANFGNSIPQTKLYQDFASCASENVKVVDSTAFTSESAKLFINQMPSISAKFDGFMDYRLSELKATDDSGYYSISTDLKFGYGDVPSISAPTDYTSITDIINEITVLMSQPSATQVETNV